MAELARFAASELIVGGQKSGKSRRAEILASQWLAQCASHRAVLIATARPGDAEMEQRIARHRQDRAARVPQLQTVEEPLDLAAAIARCSNVQTLVVIDCLNLWLTNWLLPIKPAMPKMPGPEFEKNDAASQYGPAQAAIDSIASGEAGRSASGPLVWVSNEIGLGVIPLGLDTREFVDALGSLNQAVAASCERVSFMAAGLPIYLKGGP